MAQYTTWTVSDELAWLRQMAERRDKGLSWWLGAQRAIIMRHHAPESFRPRLRALAEDDRAVMLVVVGEQIRRLAA